MTRMQKIFGFLGVATAVVLSSCSLWAHLQSPEDAKADSYRVWISVLKGFGQDVYYIGTKEPYAYFRIGSVFPTYYKSPACNFTLPREFDIGAEKPYVVVQGNLRGYNSTPTCER
jgi:hypothetical protein